MSCAVALANSPVFSPSSSRVSSAIFCKSSACSSPEAISLTLNNHHHHHGSSSSAATSSCGSPSPSSSSTCASPSSPFRLRFQKPLSGFRPSKKETSPPTLLKRKRPAKIDIPISVLGFAAATTPVPTEVMREVEFEMDGVSVYCKKGRRELMEDRYSAVLDLQGDPKQAFFGVFDGHGGARAAEFAAENLDKNIMDELTRRGENEIEDAIKSGYLTTDSEFLKEDLRGGTCCVTALITKGALVVSNAGDCRAVMSRGGIAEALTSDHRPSRLDEKERIEALGGYVDSCHGVWRLQGSLAVSRGIGDRSLKQWVTAEPETKVLKINSECEFLILASDGLWDKVGNQEAVDMVRLLSIGTDKPELMSACRKLAELSVMRGSADDVSVMVIQFGRFI
ncbi:probable protein phosphatase 2C 25 [Macadamia integrifolia]|uniref:probable protein phosphatase 2C 25 n=1 Tax=Macadamia integrifolia TaxID=60698 RepID=UPI001C4EE3C7|nr:probable protein phosphatase 2C 25 [Macadamia integrifolia]